MKRLILLFLITVSVFFSYSQNIQTIEFNKNSRSINLSLPSQKTFNLKMEYPGEFVDILVIEHIGNKNLCNSISSKKFPDKIFPIPKHQYWVTKEEEKKYLYIRFDRNELIEKKRNNFLSPMKDYSILILKTSSDIEALLLKYIKERDIDEFKNEYLNKFDELNCVSQYFWDGEVDFINDLEKKISTTKKDDFEALLKEKNKITLKESPTRIKDLTDPMLYEQAILFYANIDTLTSHNTGINPDVAVNLLLKYRNYKNNDFKNLINGTTNEKQEKKVYDVLLKELNQLDKITTVYALLGGTANAKKIQSALIKFKEEVANNFRLHKKQQEIKSKFLKLIPDNNAEQNLAPYVITGDSYILSFKERNKLKFTPDLGLICYGFQESFTGVSPYVGFHYNLSYLDKNIAFKKIPNKNIFDFLSINIGITTNSIEEENKRKGIIGNQALMTGLGIRINNTFRISTGSLLFKKINENPLSNNTSISTTPYAGLSLDFEINELLNGFTKLFAK